MPLPLRKTARLAPVYGLAAVAVTVVWLAHARTEGWAGEPPELNWTSIPDAAAGTLPAPFVGRRLLPDAARLLSRAVPAAAWERAAAALAADTPAARAAHRLLFHTLNWRPEHLPLMLSAVGLLYLSVIGFMLASRRLLLHFYAVGGPNSHLFAVAAGFALLGGGAGQTEGVYDLNKTLWLMYPYDLPQACVFAWGLVGVVGRRGWFWLLFPVAAYSKETSALLIVAYVVTPAGGHWRWKAAGAAALAAAFLLIRWRIAVDYPNPAPQAFFQLPRNLKFLAVNAGLFGSWFLPVYTLAGVAVARQWGRFPPGLRRLLVLVPLGVGACLFKGLIEERRAYYELFPIVGLLAVQTAALELGRGHLMPPRHPPPDPAAP